jgi:hypothetical protein
MTPYDLLRFRLVSFRISSVSLYVVPSRAIAVPHYRRTVCLLVELVRYY